MRGTVYLVLLPLTLGWPVLGTSQSTTLESTQVSSVYPRSGVVHENLLRISLKFPVHPQEAVFPRLRLVHINGVVITKPFLNQELWSPDDGTLTILFGPGRVKTGLIAHDQLGRAFEAGDHVKLFLDRTEIADWTVDRAYVHPIDTRAWSITPPSAHTRQPLLIDLQQPIDGMDQGLIAVGRNGRPVAGVAVLQPGERVWRFNPVKQWQAGSYEVMVHPHLEDPYGNEPGNAFETSKSAQQSKVTTSLHIDFAVR